MQIKHQEQKRDELIFLVPISPLNKRKQLKTHLKDETKFNESFTR